MHRSILLVVVAAATTLSPLACGNLIIPTNDQGDGGDDDGGGDGSVGRVPVTCDAGIPTALACTGLYSDWESLTLSPDVQEYEPGLSMWSDTATSKHYIWLPPGSKITTADPNNWVFPVGTKIWQELSILGVRVETRFLWKEAAVGGWFRATYAWTPTLSAANQLTIGMPNARGLPYEIPPVSACEQCHNGANDFVLGFEEVSLGMPKATGLNLRALEQKSLLTVPPTANPVIPGDATASASLAFLHANCGTSCHNRNNGAQAGQVGMFLKLTVDSTGALPATEQQTDTWITSYEVPSHFTPGGYVGDSGAAPPATATASATIPPPVDASPDGMVEAGTSLTTLPPPPPVTTGPFLRLAPQDLAHSMIFWRMDRRDGVAQMPPIDTHVVDTGDVILISAWVAALPP